MIAGITYLTTEQLDALREGTETLRDYLLIEVQFETGCTVSELASIKRDDVKSTHIKVSDRTCRVSETLLKRIQEFLKQHESRYLFPSRQQEAITCKRVQQIVKKYIKGLTPTVSKQSPHILRYTHIVHALKNNIPPPAIMKQTGLGELRISQIIAQVQSADQDSYSRMFQ